MLKPVLPYWWLRVGSGTAARGAATIPGVGVITIPGVGANARCRAGGDRDELSLRVQALIGCVLGLIWAQAWTRKHG